MPNSWRNPLAPPDVHLQQGKVQPDIRNLPPMRYRWEVTILCCNTHFHTAWFRNSVIFEADRSPLVTIISEKLSVEISVS